MFELLLFSVLQVLPSVCSRGLSLTFILLSFIKSAQFAGNHLTQCTGSALPIMYSLAGANVAGHTKKISMNAVLLMAFCLGNIFGPLIFRTEDEPDYVPAKIAILATLAVAIDFTFGLRGYNVWENSRREKAGDGRGDVEFLDLIDRENRGFRYKL